MAHTHLIHKKKTFFLLFLMSLPSFLASEVHASDLVVGARAGTALNQFQVNAMRQVLPFSSYAETFQVRGTLLRTEVFLGYKEAFNNLYLLGEFSITSPGPRIGKSNFQMSPLTGYRAVPLPLNEHEFGLSPKTTYGLGLALGVPLTSHLTLQVGLKVLSTQFMADYRKYSNGIVSIYTPQGRQSYGLAPNLQISYALTPNLNADIGYAYQIYQKVDAAGLSDETYWKASSRFRPQYHQIMLGLSYTFPID